MARLKEGDVAYKLTIVRQFEGVECQECEIGTFVSEQKLKRWAEENDGELEKVK